MEMRLRGNVFQSLKLILKNRQMTYADLAAAMEVSEPTIKRMFVEQDCKMGRLLKMCDVLEVSLSDVMDRAKRAEEAAFELPLETERLLAREPLLFYMFILLRDGISDQDIQDRYDISPSQYFLNMRQLEKMGLARTRQDGTITVYKEIRIQFRRHGPLRGLIRHINTEFFVETYERPDSDVSAFRTLSRRMLPDTAAFMRKELTELVERVNRLARQDQMIAKESELKSYKIATAFGPFHLPEILQTPQDED